MLGGAEISFTSYHVEDGNNYLTSKNGGSNYILPPPPFDGWSKPSFAHPNWQGAKFYLPPH